jgi:hypothetical protein
MPSIISTGSNTARSYGYLAGGAFVYNFKGFSSTGISLPADGVATVSGSRGGGLTYSSGAQVFFGVGQSSSSAVNQYNTIGPPANGQNWTGGRGAANVGFGYVGSGQYLSSYSNTLNQILTFGTINNSISGTVGTPQFWYSTTNPGWGGTGWGNGTPLSATHYPLCMDWSPALGLWACLVYNGSSAASGIITSTNGSTWSTSQAELWSSSYQLQNCSLKWISGLGSFVIYSPRTSDNHLLYITSTNGTSWSTPTAVSGTNATSVNVGVPFAYSPTLNTIVMMSSYQSAYATGGAGSLGGSGLTAVGGTPSSTYFFDVIWNSVANIFIAGGYLYSSGSGASSVYYPCYSTSTNGITWTTPTAIQTSTQLNWSFGYGLGSLAYSTDTGITCMLVNTVSGSANYPVIYYSI